MKAATGGRFHHDLVCALCGKHQDDDGLILSCPQDHEPALLRTEYVESHFRPDNSVDGLFRYSNWLPVVRSLPGAGRTIVYRSEKLSRILDLPDLWIAFNGYWPERGATLETATFKELEAYTVLGRLPDQQVILTAASAGNTGAAFALSCSRQRVPCLLIVPERSLQRFRFRERLHPCVRLVAVQGEYPDAIAIADALAGTGNFYPEGGVKNVGRRDGLSTVLLAAFEETRRLPDYYFQAVGSGTGGIAVHESALRLRAAENYPGPLPRLMLCQNLPFTPIYDSWRRGQRPMVAKPAHEFRNETRQVRAGELTNWKPPYSICGGVYDVLTESSGDVLATDNASVTAAMEMFRELEGVDIEPAAGVALACLRAAAADGTIPRASQVVLNVTGGGRNLLERDHALIQAVPDLHLDRESLAPPESVNRLSELCQPAVPAL
jgi:cysteate synthase